MVDRLTRRLADIPSVEIVTATFSQINSDGTAQIDFGDGEITVSTVYFPRLAGEQVRVLRVNAQSIVLGPAVPFPAEGVVTADNGSTMTVTSAIGSLELPFIEGTAPVVSDTVEISTRGVIQGPVSDPATSDYVPPGAPGTGGTFTVEFRAADSGSRFAGSWWTNDVRCSDGNVGAWFYGTTIADTIPDTATIGSVEVYVKEIRNQFPGSLATVGVHSLTEKVGVATVTDAVTITAGSGWKTLPTTFGDALKSGTRRGLGTDEGGLHVFAGRASDADSGLLRISYSI